MGADRAVGGGGGGGGGGGVGGRGGDDFSHPALSELLLLKDSTRHQSNFARHSLNSCGY